MNRNSAAMTAADHWPARMEGTWPARASWAQQVWDETWRKKSVETTTTTTTKSRRMGSKKLGPHEGKGTVEDYGVITTRPSIETLTGLSYSTGLLALSAGRPLVERRERGKPSPFFIPKNIIKRRNEKSSCCSRRHLFSLITDDLT